MPSYKYNIGDKVLFLRNEYSALNIARDAIGTITDLVDIDESPDCYSCVFPTDIAIEDDTGQVQWERNNKQYHFNERQIALVSSSVMNSYTILPSDFQSNQMVLIYNMSELTDNCYTEERTEDGSLTGKGTVAIISAYDETTSSEIVIRVMTATRNMFLDLNERLIDNNISLLREKDIKNYSSENFQKDLQRIANKMKIPDCAETDSLKCDKCNEWTYVGEYSSFTGHGIFCLKCTETFRINCNGCFNTWFASEVTFRRYKEKDYCQSCYDTKVFKCTQCRKEFESMTPLIYDTRRYCSECFELTVLAVMASPPRMLSRSSISRLLLPSDKMYSLNKSKTAVAIEIEAVNPFLDYEDIRDSCDELPRGWHDTSDSSISGSGREFIMTPEVGDAALIKVSNFCDWLQKRDWKVNNSCGIHVHTDAFYLGVNELKGILLTARALEPFIYKMLPKSREESTYSKPMYKIDSTSITDIKTISDLCKLWYEKMNDTNASSEKYNSSRYRGFNLHSRFLHGTIEYRYHHGTISDYYINNWILFCIGISDFGKNFFSNKHSVKKLFISQESKDYTDYFAAMGISNLIPYVEEMIDRSSLSPDNLPTDHEDYNSQTV